MAAAVASSSLVVRALSAASVHHSHSLSLSHSDGRRIGDHSRGLRFFSKSSPPLIQSRSSVAFSRRNSNTNRSSARGPTKNKKLMIDDHGEEDDLDEDALEALFNQLEEDLENDNLSADDIDDEISEEELAKLEQELEEAFSDGFEDELSGKGNLDTDNTESHDDDDDDDDDERPLKLKNWQLRRIASALKIGRRKTGIKNLAAELGLDRAVVLELLRDPPPNLLLMCASLPDTVVPASLETKRKPVELSPVTVTESKPVESSEVDAAEPEPVVKGPVHVMKTTWAMQKRLKKVHVETLERVYSRTKRPTNTMISSIVHVTSLPRKTVVKWFEDKRQQDGIPDQRFPFRRSVPETVSTN